MAHDINSLNANPRPVILTVPGLGNSGPGHWQTAWEASLPASPNLSGCRRVDLGLWDDPHRNTWVNKLNLAIQRAEGPVILAAHSLGCMAVAWWAEYEQPGGPADGGKVIGALLVASRNDAYLTMAQARRLARGWASRLADAGEAGHINAQSGLGDWAFGRLLLNTLLPQPLPVAQETPRALPASRKESVLPWHIA